MKDHRLAFTAILAIALASGACGGGGNPGDECTPADEVCDGVDNDCDDLVDEDVVPGAGDGCDTQGVCAGLAPACEGDAGWVCDYSGVTGYSPTDAECDGDDNDCDGDTDEDYVPDAACGVGACLYSNTPSSCVGGVETPCAPGTPAGTDDTDCDAVDDDCDGYVDEEFLPDESCGVGHCLSTNTPSVCMSGIETPCAPGSPLSSEDTTCEGTDDDCDGSADEDYVPDATCGEGYCNAHNTPSSCSGGAPTACAPGSPLSATDATCDGVDDDCDASIDEEFAPDDTCGLGWCHDTNTPSSCTGGAFVACLPGVRLSLGESVCDGVDEDCDGLVDTGCPSYAEQAGSPTALASHGGTTGGAPFLMDCPPGEFVRGIYGHTQPSAFQFTGVGLVCGSLDAVPDVMSDPWSYDVATSGDHDLDEYAMGAGTAYRVVCPDDEIMIGYEGYASSLVYQVTIHCGGPGIAGSHILFTVDVDGAVASHAIAPPAGPTASGAHFGPDACPDGQAVSGMYGRAGLSVDALGFRCRAVDLVLEGDTPSGCVAEACGGADENCDGVVDEGCPIDVLLTGSYDLSAYGGSGGSPYVRSCGADQALVGFDGTYYGSPQYHFTTLNLHCSDMVPDPLATDPVTFEVDLAAPVTVTGVGSPLGTTYTGDCPAGTVMVGLAGYASGLVYHLTIYCSTPQITNPYGQWEVAMSAPAEGPTMGAASGYGGAAFGPDYCSGRRLAVGIHGNAGLSVDSIGLTCSQSGLVIGGL